MPKFRAFVVRAAFVERYLLLFLALIGRLWGLRFEIPNMAILDLYTGNMFDILFNRGA